MSKQLISKHFIYLSSFLLSLIVLLLGIIAGFPDGLLHVYFLDIGQGDSILLRTPSGQNILVDGGPGTKVIEELSSILPFYDKTIDLLILTHPDKDHIEGTIDILKFYQVQSVLFTGINSPSPYYKSFLSEIDRQKIPIYFANKNQDFTLGQGVFIDIIYPLVPIAGLSPLKPNNTSVVFNLIYKNQKILFTGDIEKPVEEKILNSGQFIHADFLKVAHHGSKTSSTKPFLQSSSPHTAIIQLAQNNQHHHPSPETLKSFQDLDIKNIYRNDHHGLIEIVTNGKTYKIITEKN